MPLRSTISGFRFCCAGVLTIVSIYGHVKLARDAGHTVSGTSARGIRRIAGSADAFIFRNSTASKPGVAIPVRVSKAFGYIRTWNDRTSSGFTALGLRRPRTGEQAMTINGVLYPVESNDMAAFALTAVHANH
jgi:hypothetical protein